MTDIFSRGGMCANPFGGEDRIDRINLLEYIQPNQPPEKVLFARIIQDAVSNYLYAFLGKNGTSAEEFFASWQYFFKVNYTDRASWDHNRIIKNTTISKGKKVTTNRELTDSELQMMCFDRHYELSGLNDHLHIDKFRQRLKEKRTKILTNNWEQVVDYIDALYQRELSQITDGHQVPLSIWQDNMLSILVDPPTPVHLASVIYVPSKLKRPRRQRVKKIQRGKYALLAERLEARTQRDLDGDWGPLAELLGTNDDKVIDNDRISSPGSDLIGSVSTTSPSDSRQVALENQDPT